MTTTTGRIRTEQEHADAMKRIDQLWGAPVGTSEGDELEALCASVEAYEKEVVDFAPYDPLAFVRVALDQRDLGEDDLIPILGSREKVSEVMSGKGKITDSQAESLGELLGVDINSIANRIR